MKKNSVSHFEIYADDPEQLQQFYTSLFDWTFESVPGMDYRFIKTVDADEKGMPSQRGGINGGMLTRPAGFTERAWLNYVNVESIDASVARAEGLGATVMRPKTAVPGMGWFIILMDPQRNVFSLWQTDPGAK